MAELTILQVVPRLDAGGSEQAAVEIAEALTRAGVSALVATEGGRRGTALTEAGGGVGASPFGGRARPPSPSSPMRAGSRASSKSAGSTSSMPEAGRRPGAR